MTAIPARWASAGPCRVTGCPSISSAPESGRCTPASIFTIVDLPAPFSPTSACASPAYRSMLPLATACTAPNALVTWCSASTGVASPAAGAAPGAAAGGAVPVPAAGPAAALPPGPAAGPGRAPAGGWAAAPPAPAAGSSPPVVTACHLLVCWAGHPPALVRKADLL